MSREVVGNAFYKFRSETTVKRIDGGTLRPVLAKLNRSRFELFRVVSCCLASRQLCNVGG